MSIFGADIVPNLKFHGFPEGAEEVTYVISDLDAYFDHGMLPENALTTGDAAVTDDVIVTKWVDHIATGFASDINSYIGATTQRTSGGQPKYYEDETGKYVRALNLFNTKYRNSSAFAAAVSTPVTVLYLFRNRMSYNGESYYKDNDEFHIRNHNDSYYHFGTGQGETADTTVGSWPGRYDIHYALVKYDSSGPSFILDGVEVYDDLGSINADTWARSLMFTANNVAGHDMYGRFYKEGTFTTTEESELDAIIKGVWDIDTVNTIYNDMTDLTVEWDDSVNKRWYLSIDGGSTEYTSWAVGTTFQWIEAGVGTGRDFTNQNFITQADHGGSSGDATTARLARADYPTLFPNDNGTDNVWLMCIVDIADDVHHQVEQLFIRDVTA